MGNLPIWQPLLNPPSPVHKHESCRPTYHSPPPQTRIGPRSPHGSLSPPRWLWDACCVAPQWHSRFPQWRPSGRLGGGRRVAARPPPSTPPPVTPTAVMEQPHFPRGTTGTPAVMHQKPPPRPTYSTVSLSPPDRNCQHSTAKPTVTAPQPLWQAPPTASLTASDTPSRPLHLAGGLHRVGSHRPVADDDPGRPACGGSL